MKLHKLLNTLSTRERTQFQQFIASPLFNKRQDVQCLLVQWMKEGGRSFPPEVFWNKVFPDQDFSRTQWNLLTSRLFKLLEDFLAINDLRKDEVQKKRFLARAYRGLKQEKHFEKTISDAQHLLEKQPYRNTDYLENCYDLAFARYDYITSGNRKEKTNLQEVSDHLDAYVLAAKLRQACNARSRQNINPEQYEIGFLEETFQYLERQPQFLEIPAIAVYYHCYRAIQASTDETHIRLFRETIVHYQDCFQAGEIRDIYTFVINFYIRKLNTGERIYAEEALALYRLSLEQGYLLEDGVMLESTFLNIVVLASVLGDYDWAIHFIETYREHLKPAFREPLYHFGLGKLYYEQGQFTASLQQLIQVETKVSFIFLGARILQLKIYYETGEINPLESLLESLRVYIQRSKDLVYRKAHYSNILIFTRQLLQLPAMSKAEKEALRQRVIDAQVLGEKEWFLKQIK